jgi:hypothetical protein
MRRGSLDDFQTFITVAEAGSFTKAAAELGVSQSAVSYSVRMLEQRLGVRLIAHTPGACRLQTPVRDCCRASPQHSTISAAKSTPSLRPEDDPSAVLHFTLELTSALGPKPQGCKTRGKGRNDGKDTTCTRAPCP